MDDSLYHTVQHDNRVNAATPRKQECGVNRPTSIASGRVALQYSQVTDPADPG